MEAKIKEAEDAVRDLKNWIFTFAKEYDLAEEAIKMLHEKVDEVAVTIGKVECKAGEEEPTVKSPADALRDLKNWVSTFAEEYALADEAVDMLNTKIEALAKKITDISCE